MLRASNLRLLRSSLCRPTTLTTTSNVTNTTTSNVIHNPPPSSSFHTTASSSFAYSGLSTIRLWSPGKIFDPYTPQPQNIPWWFTPAGFRIRVKQMGVILKSGMASTRIRKDVPSFAPDEIGDEAEELFRAVHRAYEDGNKPELKHNLTEQLFPHLKRGLDNNWALTNTNTTPLRLVGMASRPNVVQMRVVNVNGKKQQGEEEKSFAQVTIRVDGEYMDANVTHIQGESNADGDGAEIQPQEPDSEQDLEQEPEQEPENGQEQEQEQGHVNFYEKTQRKKGKGNKKNKGKKTKNKSSDIKWVVPSEAKLMGESARGEWRSTYDEDGKIYYYHTETEETTFDAPNEWVVDGHLGQDDSLFYEDKVSGATLYRSIKYIILERDLTLKEQGRWRLCKLQ